MTPSQPQRSEPPAAPEKDPMLEKATSSLREHVDQRWVQISDRVRSRALRATRPSLPVRAQASTGPVHVSEQVLITYLRDALSAVPHTKVQDITITTEGIDTYTGVTITIQAGFGAPLIPLADTIRDLANQRLTQLLGPIAPPVSVTTMVVHIEDVFLDNDRA